MTSTDDFDPYLAWLDIKPAEHPVDHYKLLGLDRFESDDEVIRQAADARMGHVRSFQTGPRGRFTQNLLNELAAAKLCLLNPSTKTTYDAALQGTVAAGHSITPLPPPVQDFDDARIVPPQPTAFAGVAEPTPPPVEESSITESATEPIVRVVRPHIRRRSTGPLTAIIVIILSLGVVAGSIIAIINLPDASSDTKPPNKDDPDDLNASQKDSGSRKLNGPIVIEQEADGSFRFPATTATLHGANLKRVKEGGQEVVTNWAVGDSISWRFHVTTPGVFTVKVVYDSTLDSSGSQYLIEIGQRSKLMDVRPADIPNTHLTDECSIAVTKPGQSNIRITAKRTAGGGMLKFKLLKVLLDEKKRAVKS